MKPFLLFLTLSSLSFSTMALPAPKGTVTCTLKSVTGPDESSAVLLASDTQPAGPYGANFLATSASGTMTFAMSTGHNTSAIITDEKTGQISMAYFRGGLNLAFTGSLVSMTVHNTSEGTVFLNCERD